jgi:hypothetical protein
MPAIAGIQMGDTGLEAPRLRSRRYPRRVTTFAFTNAYQAVFDDLDPKAFESLFDWQQEALAELEGVGTDAAIELPTGAGKTVAALLVCEEYRRRTGHPVAYLTGTKQLTQQVAAEGGRLGVPVIPFHGSKSTWDDPSKTQYEFADAVGVMNYWNYFNESPGVGPAGLLVMDDVHLAEGPLRDFFAVRVAASEPLFQEILKRIRTRFDYYGLVNDLLDGLVPISPAEMLSPLDSCELAGDLVPLLDAQLRERSDPWWAWRRTRSRAVSCCWVVSPRGITITPWIPPSMTIDHFADPERRLYLSATIGDVDDLRRRLGCPPLARITAKVPPRQGERYVAIVRNQREQDPEEVVQAAMPLVAQARKALWLCARSATAQRVAAALEAAGDLPVQRLSGNNGAADAFSSDAAGHLVCAGRYDGMDFPDDACRLEVLPELPIATSDLEEFISSYLRDASFAEARFAQRVAQALGRCNRSDSDRAVYLLWNAGFQSRLGTRRGLGALPEEARTDVYAAVRRSGDPHTVLAEAASFLEGQDYPSPSPPPTEVEDRPGTAGEENHGVLRLWSEDYAGAAAAFERVANACEGTAELQGFWFSMQALALSLAYTQFRDDGAGRQVATAIAAAIDAGGMNTFFSRLRASQARRSREQLVQDTERNDHVFAAWDAILDQRQGAELDTWTSGILTDLEGNDHDAVARATAVVAGLLGIVGEAPKAKQGEHDAAWRLGQPSRVLVFDVKLAPQAKKTSIKDVNQIEGAARAEASRPPKAAVRGVLVTPHEDIDKEAIARLDLVRLLSLQEFQVFTASIVRLITACGNGWGPDARARRACRLAVEGQLPDPDALWRAHESADEVWMRLP